MESKLIGIEGHSFSGKTTLMEDLEASRSGDLGFIKEHDVYANGSENFPKIPFQTQKQANSDIEYFLELESKRTQDALRMVINPSISSIFMDRTIISVLLLQLYLKEKRRDWLNSFDESVEIYSDAVRTGKVYIPERFIFLDTADDLTFLTRTERKVSLGFYKDLETRNFMNFHYLKILNRFYDESSSLVIKSKNSIDSRKDLVLKVKDFTQHSKPSVKTKNLIKEYFKK